MKKHHWFAFLQTNILGALIFVAGILLAFDIFTIKNIPTTQFELETTLKFSYQVGLIMFLVYHLSPFYRLANKTFTLRQFQKEND